ncbi:hypothetical protein GCM10027414_31960 [Humibacter ginsengiterrae]
MPGTVVCVRRSLGWSAAFAVAFLVLYALAVLTPWGLMVDGHSLGQPYAAVRSFSVLRWACPAAAGAAAAISVVVALVRKRWADTLVCLLAAGAVILASGWLRDDVLARLSSAVAHGANSYPSRHVVITCAIALIVLRLWPWAKGRRVVDALAIAAVVIDAVASVATYSHRASDTIGAVLLVGVLAPVYARGRFPGLRDAVLRRPPTLVVAAAVWLCALAVAALADGVVATTGYLVLIALGTGALTLVLGRAVSTRRAA